MIGNTNAITIIQGGGGAIVEKDVNFYDYDGTLVQGYSKAEFLALSNMPENPSHSGLVAQGWNWSLADAKSYVTDYKELNIGQMYKTSSGLTEFDIELTKATGLTISFAMNGNVNWGDGISEVISEATTHTYANYGKYTISSDGTALPTYIFRQTVSTPNECCINIRIGENVSTIADYAFQSCSALKYITIPNTLTSIQSNIFMHCYNLEFVAIPTSITTIRADTFKNCHLLKTICLPNTVADIYLESFQRCYSLKRITLPNSLVAIRNNGLDSCSSLKKLIMPSSITALWNSAFAYCYGMMLYDFSKAASIPTLSSGVFAGINKQCKIVVPDSLYSTWITASNWVSYADYIYKESDLV